MPGTCGEMRHGAQVTAQVLDEITDNCPEPGSEYPRAERAIMETQLKSVVDAGASAIQIPKSTIRVMELTQNPDTEIETLAEAIQIDAALGARVLSVANSPAYATQRNITNIYDAVMWMGFREIARIAIAVGALSEISRMQTRLIGMADFHRHSVEAACLSDRLAQHYNVARDVGFTAGLLHDIGLLVMFSACEAQMIEVLEKALFDDEKPLHFHEKETLGFDHAQVGGELAERWGLPRAIVSAIRHHHDLDAKDEHREGVAVVAYANHILTTLDGAADSAWPEYGEQQLEKIAESIKIGPELDLRFVEMAQADAAKLMSDSGSPEHDVSTTPATATAS